MKRIIGLVVAICIGASLIGCKKKDVSQIPIKNIVLQSSSLINTKMENTKAFIELLKKSGYKIKNIKENKESLLLGNPTPIDINGNIVVIWEYRNDQEMEKNAKIISTDGSKIGNRIYDWKADPHFYKGGNVIVSYFGDNKEVITGISKLMGQEFAGII